MISVIIATKNGEKYIARAIQNALQQSVAVKNLANPEEFAGFEIVVISDGSTDGTASIVRGLTANDSRIRLIGLAQNVGPGLARAKGIESSRNPYIAILDDDDSWINPHKLENQLAFLEQNKNILAVGAEKIEFVDENGKKIRWQMYRTDPKQIRTFMLMFCPIVNSSILFRKESYEKAGGFSDMRLSEDYDLLLRLGQIGDLANIGGAETKYTMRSDSASGSNGKAKFKMAIAHLMLLNKYYKHYPNRFLAFAKAYARIPYQYLKSFKSTEIVRQKFSAIYRILNLQKHF
jgi:glycosyltransferase involved in cell wall biosynthesis